MQNRSKKQGHRRLMMRLDTASFGADDTGLLDTAAQAEPVGGVALGISWSEWERSFDTMMDVDPWDFTVPHDAQSLFGTAEAFAAVPEAANTAVLVAFYDDGEEEYAFRSLDQGRIRAARYKYLRSSEEITNLQLVIDNLELEGGAKLTLRGDIQISGTEIESD